MFFSTSQKFFRAIQSQKIPQKMTFFIIFVKYWAANKPTSGTIKSQKLPSADVWKRRMCLRRRMGLPFTLEDRYDHKQAFKYIFYVMKTYRKFFRGPWSHCRHLWKPFFEVITKGRLCLGVWFSKNRHLLAFMAIESDLSVVWSFRLLCKIDMNISKLAIIYFMSWIPIENFLEGPEVTVNNSKNSLFEVTRKDKTCFWV